MSARPTNFCIVALLPGFQRSVHRQKPIQMVIVCSERLAFEATFGAARKPVIDVMDAPSMNTQGRLGMMSQD